MRDEQVLATHAKVSKMSRRQDDFISECRQDKAVTNRRLAKVERNVGRIALQPGRRHFRQQDHGQQVGADAGSDEDAAVPEVATLSRCPKTLYDLWTEYESGIAGRKPARLFTAQERGKNKFKYSRRKIAWDAIDRMMKSGDTAQVACDRIYNVHGRNKSVSEIINCLRRDGPAGHTMLR